MTVQVVGPGGVGAFTVVKSPNPTLNRVIDNVPLPLGTSVRPAP